MPGGARAIGTVAEPRADQAGGDPAPRGAARRPRGSCGRSSRVGGLLLAGLLLGALVAVVGVVVAAGLRAVGAALGLLALLDAVGVALVGRLALLVEVVAEVVGELLDEALDLLDGGVVPVALGDLVED